MNSRSSSGRKRTFDRSWRLLLVNALPGLLAGTHIANQLFFLNPDLPFGAETLARAGAVYALCGGLLAMLLLTPVTWGRGGRARRLLPWTLTLVLAYIAISDFVFASRYSFYLPPGINRRMIKAAIWLSLLSLIFFYTALLHTLHRRPYGWRSRVGLTVFAFASIYVMAERREAFKPFVGPTPLPSAVEPAQVPNLYVVGLGGASLDPILPLSAQGRLPFFAKMLASGIYARPTSLAPVQAEALWTTLATGRVPYEHGIVTDSSHPAGLISDGAWVDLLPTAIEAPLWDALAGAVPVDARRRKKVAMWDVFERLQIRTGIVGWPVTDPVPSQSSFGFSYRYFRGFPRPPMAQPGELAERGILFRVNPEDIDPTQLEELDRRVPYEYLQDLAEDLWRESLALFLLDQQREARAVFVMLPGLAEVSSRDFGGFAEVEFSGHLRDPFLGAAQRLSAYYRHLDMFLTGLWERDRGPKILAVVSAYGYEAPEGWRRLRALITGQRTHGLYQQAPDGLFMMMGQGVRRGQFLEGVELVDVMPTLLYSLGVPIAQDLEGRVLTGAFETSFLATHPLTFVPSYDTLFLQGGVAPFPLVPR